MYMIYISIKRTLLICTQIISLLICTDTISNLRALLSKYDDVRIYLLSPLSHR